jgi:hypothetical protein
MKFFSMVLLIAFVSLPALPALPALGQAPDTQALQILEQTISAAGGRQAWMAMNDFRTRTWLWKDGAGILSAGNTHSSRIGRHNLAALEGITSPIQKLLALLDSPSRSIQLVESALIDGRQAYRLRLVRTATERKEAVLLGRQSFTTDFIIDQTNFLIIAIEDSIYPNASTSGAFQHKVTYGDFRPVAGLQMPFSMKEEIAGQTTWGLQLESIEANVGLAASEFELQ